MSWGFLKRAVAGGAGPMGAVSASAGAVSAAAGTAADAVAGAVGRGDASARTDRIGHASQGTSRDAASAPVREPATTWRSPARTRADWIALGILMAASCAAFLVNLTANGYGNEFYAAAAQAGSQSWWAYLWGALDGVGAITVDKPPAALWVTALFVRVMGLSSLSILLPQALMGIACTYLVYAITRRYWGNAAGIAAGALFASTPVAVLMFRFNNPDALLVLLMLGAGGAVLRAMECLDTRRGRRVRTRWLALAGACCGLGFLTKQLQVALVLPGFALAMFACSDAPWRRRLLDAAVALGSMALAGGWWVLLTVIVPSGLRPYIGGSETDSFIELTFGYNGFGRLTGNESGAVVPGGSAQAGAWGETGLFRLFGSDFAGQIAWLAPLAFAGLAVGVALALRLRGRDGRGALTGGLLGRAAGALSDLAGGDGVAGGGSALASGSAAAGVPARPAGSAAAGVPVRPAGSAADMPLRLAGSAADISSSFEPVSEGPSHSDEKPAGQSVDISSTSEPGVHNSKIVSAEGSKLAGTSAADALDCRVCSHDGADSAHAFRLRMAFMAVFGGWLVLTWLTFSFMAGIFHQYYTVALSPAVAMMAALAAVGLWRMRDAAWARAALPVLVALNGFWAAYVAAQADWIVWFPFALLAASLAGAVVLAAYAIMPARRWIGVAGAVLATAGLLAGPVTWSVYTVGTSHTGSIVTAGPGGGGMGGRGGRPGVRAGRGGFGGGPGGGFAAGGFGGSATSDGTPSSSGGTSDGNASASGGAPDGAAPSQAPGAGGGTQPQVGGSLGFPGGGFAGGGTAGGGVPGSIPGGGSGVSGTDDGSGSGSSADGDGSADGAGAGSASNAAPADGDGSAGASGSAGAPSGRGNGGGMGGLLGGNGAEIDDELKELLLADADSYDWVAATTGSQNAATYQLATERPVIAIGGFNGTDPAPSLDQFKEWVAAGRIHYYIAGGGMGGMGGSDGAASQIAAWVEENFEAQTVDGVTVYDLSAGTGTAE